MIRLVCTGGTISMQPDAQAGGLVPALGGEALVQLAGGDAALGEVVVAQNSYPIEAGNIPDMPELFVRHGSFESMLVDRPASLTSLADQLSAILAALKGV